MTKTVKNIMIGLYIIVAVCICFYCIYRVYDIRNNYKEDEYYVWAYHQTNIDNTQFFTSEIGYLTYESDEMFENTNYVLLVNNNKTVNNVKDDYVVDVICLPEQADSTVSENSECF